MNDVFIVKALRTPFGSLGGALSAVAAPQLAAQVMSALLDSSRLAPSQIGEVIIGQVLQGGCGQAPARQALRAAGIPDAVPAMTINKVCGSGLKAIMLAADSIRLGETSLALAGGMENMSMAPHVLSRARFGYRLGDGTLSDLMILDGLRDPYSGRHMGEITDAWVEKHGLSREHQDEFALRSYRLAQAAVNDGVFAEELAAVVIKGSKGEQRVEQDEEPFKVDFDRLPQLKPVFSKTGTLTAGNASTINDGAALCLVASERGLKDQGLAPLARLMAQATHSTDPALFAEAPVEAIRRVVARAGLKIGDIDLFEINEAFAAVPLVAMRLLNLDPEKVNVNGGAVAIGHPIGASGARLLATLVRELRRRGLRYGVATLCIGGGEAVAVCIEAL
ncbi:thiolase family protein [Geoalkalibacter sp.]|uniref:thiolase family protein n=1 Tax=Geoalkalibacter sp. TaxID=3041440 RepID=UPI00272DF845|nr:thiolase family protein [Geoalkalibacter sp.]